MLPDSISFSSSGDLLSMLLRPRYILCALPALQLLLSTHLSYLSCASSRYQLRAKQPSNLSTPESPTSPPSPLSPHTPHPLRKPMSNSQLGQNFLKPRPRIPGSWSWRCHLCQSVYRLGVTRRCLHDVHVFCSAVQPPTEDEASSELRSVHSKNRILRGRRIAYCESEFDYKRWANYNRWRREAADAKARRGASEDVGKEDGERNCWNNCDYPSQCYRCHTHSLGAWLETGLETEEDEKLREALDTPLCPSVDFSIVVGSHGAEKGDETVEDVSQAIGDDTKIE